MGYLSSVLTTNEQDLVQNNSLQVDSIPSSIKGPNQLSLQEGMLRCRALDKGTFELVIQCDVSFVFLYQP